MSTLDTVLAEIRDHEDDPERPPISLTLFRWRQLLEAAKAQHADALRLAHQERDEADKQRANERHAGYVSGVDDARAEALEEAKQCARREYDSDKEAKEAHEAAGREREAYAFKCRMVAANTIAEDIGAIITTPAPKSEREMVRDFHAKMDQPHPATPTMLDADGWDLRDALMSEELREAVSAGRAGDFVATVHELGDLIYTVYGSFVALGVDPRPVVSEIHRANMHKESVPGGKAKKPENWDEVKPDVAKVLRAQGWTPPCERDTTCGRAEGHNGECQP